MRPVVLPIQLNTKLIQMRCELNHDICRNFGAWLCEQIKVECCRRSLKVDDDLSSIDPIIIMKLGQKNARNRQEGQRSQIFQVSLNKNEKIFRSMSLNRYK
ncbi:Hypothetical_protein [Hexamita inflata]|uniref:Hypothetical_protein n=1 Tax=Hexamita inflata TaxID=28002 RepID=A0AA86PM57_9EUKA|nr:Hypothetical protein HINF_LOCUS30320 [Hexamita inflata]